MKYKRKSNINLSKVLNFCVNTLFNIMLDEHRSIGVCAVKKHRQPVNNSVMTNNAHKTERGLYCIGRGILCDIFKKARGKRMYRSSLNLLLFS